MIINRALVREVLHTSFAVTLVMMCIFIVVRMVGFLRAAADGDIPIGSVMLLLALKLVSYVDIILPLMLYVAVLMVLGRWNRDNEMVVISASGIGLNNFLKPLAVLVLIVGSLVAMFTLYLSPLSVRVGGALEAEYKQRSEISGVVPGVFAETKNGAGVYFVEQFEPVKKKYENIFVYNTSLSREGVVVSKHARQQVDALTNDRFLVLESGTRYEGNPGELNYRIMEFETYAIRLKQQAPPEPRVPIRGRTMQELYTYTIVPAVVEWHWRLSKLISLPIIMLFALTFSHVNARRSRVPSMLLAFIAYFGYTNMMGFTVALMKKGSLNPHWGLWWVHAMFLLLALYLFYRRSRNKSLLPFDLSR